ncbi:tetratricopeptide repeat protein, partial [Ferrovibrio sp.]|uniref:tetratricopeptide repeat protein n=1 Tax=Ferrovibrio sp. TaxID=1917215 RepID=UPI0025BED8FF
SLGVLHEDGRGVREDLRAAIALWRKAAEQDYAPALHNLAMLHIAGDGLPQDMAQARKYLERAQEHSLAGGSVRTLYNLAKMYLDGLGGPANKPAAFALMLRASEMGFAKAQYNLGKMYRDGEGTHRDLVAAAAWFTQGAEQNYAPAQNHIGNRYLRGEGVSRNDLIGLAWLTIAARNGHNGASERLEQLRSELPAPLFAEAEQRAEAFTKSLKP